MSKRKQVTQQFGTYVLQQLGEDGCAIDIDDAIKQLASAKEGAIAEGAIEGTIRIYSSGEEYDCYDYGCSGCCSRGYTNFYFTLLGEREETDKEVKARESAERKALIAKKKKAERARIAREAKAAKAEAKERELYEKLKEKYGDAGA